MQATAPITLYRSLISGHAHRAELFLSLLGLPYTPVDIDLRAGQHKTPDYLKINPFGQVPAIDDNGTVVADSNAILVYLATKYGDAHWLPRDAEGAARVQRWLSAAASEIAFGPATARLGKRFGAPVDMEAALRRSERLFRVMEGELHSRAFLAGDVVTIADVAAYSYIARAPEGDISLDPWPAVRAWLARIEALPGFLPMIETPAPKAA